MDRDVYTFKSIEDAWKGCPALIMGRGFSRAAITDEEIDRFRAMGGKFIIVNELLMKKNLAERADMLVFLDNVTILNHFDELRKFPKPVWTLTRHADISKSLGSLCHHPKQEQGPWWVPGELYQANSSTYYALQIAFQAGCKQLWLAGVDLRLCPGDKTHADDLMWFMRESLVRNGPECLRAPNSLDMPTNTYHSKLVLQFGCFASLRVWAEAHPDDIEVYKTSDWSLLPFETKGLPQ